MEYKKKSGAMNNGIVLFRRLFYAIFFAVILFQSAFAILMTGSSPDALLNTKWNIFKEKCFEGYPYFYPYCIYDLEYQNAQQKRDGYVAEVKRNIIGNWMLIYGLFVIYQVFFWIEYLLKYRYYRIVMERRIHKMAHWSTDRLCALRNKKEEIKILGKTNLTLETIVTKNANEEEQIIFQLNMPSFVGIKVKHVEGLILSKNGERRTFINIS